LTNQKESLYFHTTTVWVSLIHAFIPSMIHSLGGDYLMVSFLSFLGPP
jgi:hypothetical protein